MNTINADYAIFVGQLQIAQANKQFICFNMQLRERDRIEESNCSTSYIRGTICDKAI